MCGNSVIFINLILTTSCLYCFILAKIRLEMEDIVFECLHAEIVNYCLENSSKVCILLKIPMIIYENIFYISKMTFQHWNILAFPLVIG